MRYTDLGAGKWRSSALGFGCSAVMGRVGRKQSLRAMSQAYDAGITFFDTARSYGYGESEAIVGEFLRGRRERVILSTKFGIVPARPSAWKRSFMPIVRTAVGLVPSVRQLIRGQVRAQSKNNSSREMFCGAASKKAYGNFAPITLTFFSCTPLRSRY